MLRLSGFAFPLLAGAPLISGLNAFKPLPLPLPVNTVVGAPIEVGLGTSSRMWLVIGTAAGACNADGIFHRVLAVIKIKAGTLDLYLLLPPLPLLLNQCFQWFQPLAHSQRLHVFGHCSNLCTVLCFTVPPGAQVGGGAIRA